MLIYILLCSLLQNFKLCVCGWVGVGVYVCVCVGGCLGMWSRGMLYSLKGSLCFSHYWLLKLYKVVLQRLIHWGIQRLFLSLFFLYYLLVCSNSIKIITQNSQYMQPAFFCLFVFGEWGEGSIFFIGKGPVPAITTPEKRGHCCSATARLWQPWKGEGKRQQPRSLAFSLPPPNLERAAATTTTERAWMQQERAVVVDASHCLLSAAAGVAASPLL